MKYFSQTNRKGETPITHTHDERSLNKFRQKFRVFMRFFGPLGNLAAFIQLIKIYREGQAQGISKTAIITSLCVLAMWSTYGFVIKDKPVIISNSIGFLFHVGILVGILIWG